MKKTIYTLIALFVFTGSIFSQSCHTSGSSICTVSGTMAQPGLSPRSDSLAPVDNGIANTTIIQFKNYNTAVYNGITVTVQQLKIDSINNLPNGLCWATNKANDTYANQESGCIKVSGTPCADPGVYKLVIKVTVTVPFLGNIAVDAASVGLKYFVRVKNYGDAEVALDTLQTVAFAKPAGYSTTQNCSPVICAPFTFTQSSTVNNSCSAPTGSLTVAASGGTAPYTYTLGTSNNTTGTFTGLAGGNYTVSVVDANTCTGTVTVAVSSSTPVFSFTQSSTPNTQCVNYDGTITVAATGGTSPYTYFWGVNSNGLGTFASVPDGTYDVIAFDANQCTDTVVVIVADAKPVIALTATTTARYSCLTSDATLTATATGGTSPYTYTIPNVAPNTTGLFTAVVGNFQTLTVTDSTGCVKLLGVSLTDSTATVTVGTSSVNASSAVATDGQATATPASGTAPYTFAWSGTAQTTGTVTGLAVGSYTVTTTDANGCSASGTVSVSFNSGINSLGKEIISMNIFPNPAVEKITVDARFVSAKNVTVEIFNLLGEKMQSKNLGLTEKISETFSVKGLAKGTYFVKINAGEKLAAYPIVIE